MEISLWLIVLSSEFLINVLNAYCILCIVFLCTWMLSKLESKSISMIQVPNWYHFNCFWKRARVTDPTDVHGLDTLRWDDQEKIKTKVGMQHIPSHTLENKIIFTMQFLENYYQQFFYFIVWLSEFDDFIIVPRCHRR
jgi:hypothetical protein